MKIDLNKAVITTKFVLENKSKITYVCHDADGDWQFFGNEVGITEEDARVVSLGEILSLGTNIEDVLWMPSKMEAWWNEENQNWDKSIPRLD